MLKSRNVREVIEQELRELLVDADVISESDAIDDELFQNDVNSMMLARLLIQLEAELGVDPFEEQSDVADIRTITDLVRVYEQALAGTAVGAGA
ncbi:MAG TPA: phosphopantetheine-binding protein [Actinocrinis sp.]|jgi:acyl carrier protein|nr:phosphopantetheine-binding protein [Actinocrinis sp.]